MRKEILESAQDILQLPEEEIKKNCKEIPELNAYYFWNAGRGGKSMIINEQGERLIAGSSLGFDALLAAFKAGRRN